MGVSTLYVGLDLENLERPGIFHDQLHAVELQNFGVSVERFNGNLSMTLSAF